MSDLPVSSEEQLEECDEELLRHRLEQAKVMAGRWFYDMSPDGARALHAKLGRWNRDGSEIVRPVREVLDHELLYEGLRIPMRIYKPQVAGKVPVILYYHGGGWVFGDIEAYDEIARLISNICDVAVITVGYPLAPEHKFPVPLMSCIESVRWAKAHAEELGGDADAVLVMGDSAGGNLTAATAIACAQQQLELSGQVILYGPLVHIDYTEVAGVRPWSKRDTRFGPTLAATSWYWDNYLATLDQAADARASVLLETELASAPPALIAAGTLDTFAEECVAYGRRLSDSGVKVEIVEYPRLTHGYIAHGWLSEAQRSARAHEATLDTLEKVKQLAHS